MMRLYVRRCAASTAAKSLSDRRTLTRNAVDQGVPRPYIKSKMGWETEGMIEHYTAGMELESEANEAFNKIKPFGGR